MRMNKTGLKVQSKVFPCRAVVFDLDGTLVDTSRDLWQALQLTLEKNKITTITKADFYQTLHYGIEKSVDLMLPKPGLDPERLIRVVHDYKNAYQELGHRNSVLYAGVIDLLEQCRGAGLKLAVCTNKESHQTRDILRLLKVDGFFSVVLGVDQVRSPKPSPEPVIKALEGLQVPISSGLFIGDSVLDANASQAANVPFLLHREGFGAAAVSAQLIDGVFDRYSELKTI